MKDFFTHYHIHLPVTSEFVDATFREIDANHDGKINFEEMLTFSRHFIEQIIPMYQAALASKE